MTQNIKKGDLVVTTRNDDRAFLISGTDEKTYQEHKIVPGVPMLYLGIDTKRDLHMFLHKGVVCTGDRTLVDFKLICEENNDEQ